MKNGLNYGAHQWGKHYLSVMFKILTLAVLGYMFYKLIFPSPQIPQSSIKEQKQGRRRMGRL